MGRHAPGVRHCLHTRQDSSRAFFCPEIPSLVTAGVFAASGQLNIAELMLLVPICAIVGDQIGYWIGCKAGQALYRREDSLHIPQETFAACTRILRKVRRKNRDPRAIHSHRADILSSGGGRGADAVRPLFCLVMWPEEFSGAVG